MYVCGIDIGSAFSKSVVLAEGKMISYHILPSGGNYRLTADKLMREVLDKAALSFGDITSVLATGYGAKNVSFAGEVISDVLCQGKGAIYVFPSARTVIDVGGQFSRVMRIDENGYTTAYLQSEKCAGGSGRFLQVIAHVLKTDLADIGPLSLKSRQKVKFNTGCAVFAESEAVSRVVEGAAVEDILAGVHAALAAKVHNLVERAGLEMDCALIGGGGKDIGLVKSIEEVLGEKLLVPEEPQIIAALGAALIAQERAVGTRSPAGKPGIK